MQRKALLYNNMINLRTYPYSHIPTMQQRATAHIVLYDAAIAAASKAPCSWSITKTPRFKTNNIKTTEITVPIIENTWKETN